MVDDSDDNINVNAIIYYYIIYTIIALFLYL